MGYSKRSKLSLALSVVMLCAFGVAGCGASGPDGRLVTVHHSFSVMGMMQSGEVREGRLQPGEEVNYSRSMDAGRCYSLLALGMEGLNSMRLSVRDPEGTALANREVQDSHAAVRVCPEVDAEYEVILRAGATGGRYSVTAWAVPISNCATPFHIAEQDALEGEEGERRWVVDATLTDSGSSLSGECIEGSEDSPEHVYAFELTEPSDVVATVEADFDSGLYLRATCGDGSAPYACNDDSQGVNPRLRQSLMPGRYFLVVDGYRGASGAYRMELQITPRAELLAACTLAAPLPSPGRSEIAQGGRDLMDAPAFSQPGPENLFQVHIASRTRLRLRRDGDARGGIALRTGCEEGLEVITSHPNVVTAELEPGNYIVQLEGQSQMLMVELHDAESEDNGAGETDVESSTASRQEIEAAFRALRGPIVNCANQERVRRSSFLRAALRAELSLDSAGRASTVSVVAGSAGASQPLRSCVEDVIQSQFALPGGLENGTLNLTYPLLVEAASISDEELERESRALALSCGDFQVQDLPLNGVITGSTSGPSGRMGASCASGAGAAENVYRLVLTEPRSVRLFAFADFDAALYIRDSCDPEGAELRCNDDLDDRYHSALVGRFAPGTYYVFVDGWGREGSGDYGNYRLLVVSSEVGDLPEFGENMTSGGR